MAVGLMNEAAQAQCNKIVHKNENDADLSWMYTTSYQVSPIIHVSKTNKDKLKYDSVTFFICFGLDGNKCVFFFKYI